MTEREAQSILIKEGYCLLHRLKAADRFLGCPVCRHKEEAFQQARIAEAKRVLAWTSDIRLKENE
jgi:hypothetical protein